MKQDLTLPLLVLVGTTSEHLGSSEHDNGDHGRTGRVDDHGNEH